MNLILGRRLLFFFALFAVTVWIAGCRVPAAAPSLPTQVAPAPTLTSSPLPPTSLPATSTSVPPAQVAATSTTAASLPTATLTPGPTPTPILYQVQADDTIWVIAAQNGLSVEALRMANNLGENDLIQPGDTLIIPPATAERNQPAGIQYRVQPGDTLTAIADRFGIDSDLLQNANPSVTPETLQVDHVLTIPWGGKHIVGEGDTLTGIASRYRVNYDALIQANKSLLDFDNPDHIEVGWVLDIPSTDGEVVDCQPVARDQTVVQYTIQRGERLFCLSRKFSVSEATILYNNLHLIGEGRFEEGVEIRIPPTDGALYTVTEADLENDVTLSEIAEWYSLSPETSPIQNWQGDPVTEPLTAGQQLFFPQADLLAGEFNSQVLVAYYDAPPADSSGEAVVEALPVPDSSGAAASFSGLEALFWDNPLSQEAPGFCPYVVGSGWSGSGPLSWPTASHEIRSDRGYRPGHTAIDLPMPAGSPVHAATGGTVIWSGHSYFAGGIVVMLAHGNHWRTVYGHLSQTNVSCGEWVGAGQLIGLSGKSGTSWEHLHFGVYQESTGHNPLQWLP